MNNTNLFGEKIEPVKRKDIQHPLEQLIRPLSQTFNEDCMIVMARYPDKYFDLAVVDPPYGIGFDGENTTMSAGMRKDGTKRKNKTWNNPKPKEYVRKDWDNKKPNREYFCEVLRVCKNIIVWGGNYFTDILEPSGGWIVWEKGVPEGMSLSQCELAWTNYNNSIKIVKILWAGYRKAEVENRIHPTQKPEKLYRWIYANYAERGQKILDTHLGSGSSRIACHKAGIGFVGCEIDKDYVDAQEKRFANYLLQLPMQFAAV